MALIFVAVFFSIIIIASPFEWIEERKRRKEEWEDFKELTKDWNPLTEEELREINHIPDEYDE